MECPFGIVAGFELSKLFGESGQGKISVHAGCLDRRITHKNHRAEAFARETQPHHIQPGVKLFPT